MTYKIDHDIKIEDKRRTAGECPYPFKEMSIGDSFEVPCPGLQDLTNGRAKVNNWVRKFRKESGIRAFSISTRTTEKGFRVWRIS